MKIVLFGGTTEGRELSGELVRQGWDVLVSVASAYGVEEQAAVPGVTVIEGRKDIPALRATLRGAALVIDATHPYARIATEHIRCAAEAEGIPCIRLVREKEPAVLPEERPEHTFLVSDAPAAARLAAELGRRILLTTGSKDLKLYASELAADRLYPRVLPLTDSIRACEAAGIPHKNIIAMQGPFSREMNLAVIRAFQIDLMITKESGRSGGFREKLLACRDAGIGVIVIARPQEDGLSYEEVRKLCQEKIGNRSF